MFLFILLWMLSSCCARRLTFVPSDDNVSCEDVSRHTAWDMCGRLPVIACDESSSSWVCTFDDDNDTFKWYDVRLRVTESESLRVVLRARVDVSPLVYFTGSFLLVFGVLCLAARMEGHDLFSYGGRRRTMYAR